MALPPASTDSQGRPNADDKEHPKGNTLVQVPVFHGNGHHQSPDEQYVGVLEVLYADLEKTSNRRRFWALLLIPLSLWGTIYKWYSLQTSEPNGNGLWATDR